MERLSKQITRAEHRAWTTTIWALRYRFWTPMRHKLLPPLYQSRIVCAMLSAHRIRYDATHPLPNLPKEMWEWILTFLPHQWPFEDTP